MRIEPARIDQVLRARDGRMVPIDKDAGGVAEDLHRIDPHLKVRFAEHGDPPFWAVYWQSDDGRDTYLVLTAEAHQSDSGVWTGLDQRIVRRIEEIDPRNRSGYNYAKALERKDAQARAEHEHRFREQVGEIGEVAAHAIRKDLGSRYRGRAFVTRKPDGL
jgi:hypothetical protein